MTGFAEFRMPKTILYGNESLTKLGEQAACLGKKVLLVSDRIMAQIGVADRCQGYLTDAGLDCVCYWEVNSEPTDNHVQEALTLCREHSCDVIVAVGGGSCIDAAKAVGLVATNGGYIGDYMGGKRKIEHKPLPLIAIPTTAGTGSEATAVTVINSTKDDVKMMIKNPALIPEIAIIDPVLTYSAPAQVTAATGIDALCHGIEAYISRAAQPLTDQFALAAIELMVRNLRKAYENGNDVEARAKASLASLQAGIAFSNASVALVHGMSRPIGALFHVPHGISNAMLLPAVLEFTKESATQRLADIGRILRPDLAGDTQQELANVTVNEVKQLCRDLKIPNLKAYGVAEEKFNQVIPKMAVDALASGSPGNNPRVPSLEEIEELYRICYNYDFT